MVARPDLCSHLMRRSSGCSRTGYKDQSTVGYRTSIAGKKDEDIMRNYFLSLYDRDIFQTLKSQYLDTQDTWLGWGEIILFRVLMWQVSKNRLVDRPRRRWLNIKKRERQQKQPQIRQEEGNWLSRLWVLEPSTARKRERMRNRLA